MQYELVVAPGNSHGSTRNNETGNWEGLVGTLMRMITIIIRIIILIMTRWGRSSTGGQTSASGQSRCCSCMLIVEFHHFGMDTFGKPVLIKCC